MIKNVRLSDPEVFLRVDVKIADEISDPIRISHDDIHFSTKNSYVIK